MPHYKLTYFDILCRAEGIRLALVATKQPFEDIRIQEDSCEWDSLRKSTPQGLLPYLEVDGKVIPQSHAIERFIARKHDLYGECLDEWTGVDVIIDTIEDGFVFVNACFYAEDKEAEKAKVKERLPKFFQLLEKCMDNYGNGEWMVGKKLSIADLVTFGWMDYTRLFICPESKIEDLLTPFPKLLKNRQCVQAIPEIAEHVKDRKPTYC